MLARHATDVPCGHDVSIRIPGAVERDRAATCLSWHSRVSQLDRHGFAEVHFPLEQRPPGHSESE